MTDNELTLPTTNALPHIFDKQNLFHPTNISRELLDIDDIPPGSSVLDIGCGKGVLVEELKRVGLKSLGIDITNHQVQQKPDVVALSQHLPFADNSFDYSLSYWGGITYPLYFSESFPDNPEIQRECVLTFLEQIQESLRVTKKEVVIHPWSLKPFFESTGMVPVGGDETPLFLAIDFKKLFEEMNLELRLGEVVKSRVIADEVHQTIHLIKSDSVDLSPLEKLVELVSKSNKGSFMGKKDLETIDSSLPKIMKKISKIQVQISEMSNGLIKTQKGARDGNYNIVRLFKPTSSNDYARHILDIESGRYVFADAEELAIAKKHGTDLEELFRVDRKQFSEAFVTARQERIENETVVLKKELLAFEEFSGEIRNLAINK